MIKLVDLLKEINEGKQVGDLYHFTSIVNLKEILKSKILIPSKERKYISFTRNKNLATLDNEKRDVKITIDGDKLNLMIIFLKEILIFLKNQIKVLKRKL